MSLYLPDGEDRFVDRKQAAEMLGLKPSTIAIWQSQGSPNRLPMRKHGRRAMYSVRDLIAWSDQRKVQPTRISTDTHTGKEAAYALDRLRNNEHR